MLFYCCSCQSTWSAETYSNHALDVWSLFCVGQSRCAFDHAHKLEHEHTSSCLFRCPWLCCTAGWLNQRFLCPRPATPPLVHSCFSTHCCFFLEYRHFHTCHISCFEASDWAEYYPSSGLESPLTARLPASKLLFSRNVVLVDRLERQYVSYTPSDLLGACVCCCLGIKPFFLHPTINHCTY